MNKNFRSRGLHYGALYILVIQPKGKQHERPRNKNRD